jgi:hypothetical protein
MSEKDRIAEIESLTVREFREEVAYCLENLRKGGKPGNTVELLATALKISLLGEDLRTALERWLQIDLWERVDKSG